MDGNSKYSFVCWVKRRRNSEAKELDPPVQQHIIFLNWLLWLITRLVVGVGVLPFFCVRSPAACSDLDFALDLFSLALFHMSCLLSRVLGIVWQYRFFSWGWRQRSGWRIGSLFACLVFRYLASDESWILCGKIVNSSFEQAKEEKEAKRRS